MIGSAIKVIKTHSVDSIGMFEMEILLSVGLIKLILKVALAYGRSSDGKARRASIGENCVLTNELTSFVSSFLNDPL